MYGMGDVLSIAGVSSVTQGSATVSADGQSIVFTPNANYFGSAQLSYQVSDGKGGLTAATATINVLAQPDAPVASVTYDTSPDGWVWIPPVYDTSGDSPVLVTPGYQAPADDLTRTSGGLSVTDADPGDTFSISLALGPNYGGVTLDSATGGWVYQLAPWYQIGGYSIDVTDQFQLRVTDGAGLSTIVNVDVQARTEDAPPPTDNGGGGSDYPIVIDLDNDGLDLIRPQDSNVWVDVNGDGRPDRLGWAASSEAVLVLDERGDGRIDQRHEYSFVGYTPGATSDLEGLQAFDSNSDRLLSAADQHWAQFGLFQDNNANGRQDAGEFVRITDTTVTSISLVREGQRQDVNGNVVFGTSEVRFADGSSTRAGDVMFNTASTGAATAPVTPSFATPSTGGSAPLLPSTPAVTASGGAGAVPNAPAVQPATTSLGTVSNTEATRVTAPATAVVSGDTTRVVSPAPAAATTVATATTTAPTVTSAHVSTTMTAPAAVVVPASSLVSLVGAPPVAAVAPAAAPAALSPGLTPAPASAAAGITPSAQAVGVSAVPLAVSAAPVADPLRATPPTAIPTAAPTVNSSAMPVVAPDPGDQPDAAVTMRDITVPVDAPAVASIATTSSSAAAVSPAISAAGTTATAAAVEVKEVAPATESTTSAAAPASPTAPEQRAASDGLSGTAPLPSSDTPVLPDAGTAQAAAPVAPRESHTPQPTLPAPPEVDKEAEGAAHVDLRVDLTGNNANATNPVLAPSTASSGPASDAEIAQQALLLNSWSNAGPTSPPETALAFVPATSGGIEVVVNPDASVLPEAANSLIAPQVGTVVSVG
jgi:VCBS repeat-containing protein